MKVLSVNTGIQSPKTTFKSSFRRYMPYVNSDFKAYGQMIIRTSSNILREDINWRDLLQYMIPHFKDKSSVNVYSLACSDLSEAYSYKIAAMEEVPKNLQSKFLNSLIACDIDKEILKSVNSGRINIFGVEFAEVFRRYGYDLSKYFKNPGVSVMVKGDQISESDTISSYEPIKELKDRLIVKRSDILTELNNINDNSNSVVMSRNALPYNSYEYTDKVIDAAKRKLKKGSLFIIGNFDTTTRNIDKKLLSNGFYQPLEGDNKNYVFERI